LDPMEILDILGNENRRRILQLLSFRPFYFNEMAKRLDLGPKAVIDHLEMLERAGLVECYRDERRRKYFRIADNVVLEVAFSPHSYGIRTYRPEDPQRSAAPGARVDEVGDQVMPKRSRASSPGAGSPRPGPPGPSSSGLSSSRYGSPKPGSSGASTSGAGSPSRDRSRPEELDGICSRLRELEDERLRLRGLMEKIASEEILIRRLAFGLIEECASDQLEAEILIALVSGVSGAESLARRLGIPQAVVEEKLQGLLAQGKVQKRDGGWAI